MRKVIVLSGIDNVATAIADIGQGDEVEAGGRRLRARQDIPFGHKIAIANIGRGAVVVKYGEKIGIAATAVVVGDHVHIHNVVGRRGRGD